MEAVWPASSRYHSWKYAPDPVNLHRLVAERERLGDTRVVNAALQSHGALLRRLVPTATLRGHSGCVNHLRWNTTGTLLASGSDDTKLILWDYATQRAKESIETGHSLNIFAVCFVPGTNDHILATGAMDKEVRIHYAPFRPEATQSFRFHRGRVKDIASSPGVPRVFWSVAEDGIVYQFDVRALPSSDGNHHVRLEDETGASGVLIRLGKSRSGELLRGMAMAVHPLDPTKVAVACGDFYTRLYDRRMLRLQSYRARHQSSQAERQHQNQNQDDDGEVSTSASASAGRRRVPVPPPTGDDATIPVEMFAPPHLHLDGPCDISKRRRDDEAHGTSVQFSSDGSELLANYHNDHIYLFNVTHSHRTPVAPFDKTMLPPAEAIPVWQNGLHMDQPAPGCMRSSIALGSGGGGDVDGTVLRRRAVTRYDLNELHSKGLVLLRGENFTRALDYLLAACHRAPAVLTQMSASFRRDLYHSIAEAYRRRAWRADAYLAAVYAKLALSLLPEQKQQYDSSPNTLEDEDHRRMLMLSYIRALHAGARCRQVIFMGEEYQRQFPEQAVDVDDLVSDATARLRLRHERHVRVYRRPLRSGRHADQRSSSEGGTSSDEAGVQSGRGTWVRNEASSGGDAGGDDNGDDNDDDDGGDDDDDDGDSSDGMQIEEMALPSENDDWLPSSATSPSEIVSDDAFWTSRSMHGVSVNADAVRRYIGYCNLQTDIKEATFFGPNDAYIVAGSDDGRAYIWDKKTGELVNAIKADNDIVNCVQPHPVDLCLATSGIESVIRLWTPTGRDSSWDVSPRRGDGGDDEDLDGGDGDGDHAPLSRDALAELTHTNQANMASTSNYRFSGTNPNIIRLFLQAGGDHEGIGDCATS